MGIARVLDIAVSLVQTTATDDCKFKFLGYAKEACAADKPSLAIIEAILDKKEKSNEWLSLQYLITYYQYSGTPIEIQVNQDLNLAALIDIVDREVNEENRISASNELLVRPERAIVVASILKSLQKNKKTKTLNLV